MAKIIAAYVAHGHRHLGGTMQRIEYPLDDNCRRQWQRIFCLFSIVRALSADGVCPRFLLISDHAPPVIDGRMIGYHLEKLNVEIHRIDHVWRPYGHSPRSDFFVFDVLDFLGAEASYDDALLIFSGESLAVNPVQRLFDELEKTGILCAEKSYGDLAEDHERALNDRMVELRKYFEIEFPDFGMRAASSDFIGITYSRLHSLLERLRKLFMRNILSASRAQDHFISSAELLAALFAEEQIYQSNLVGLSDRAAAMPDDFSVASLPDVPMIIPGYGREPDIAALYCALLGDSSETLRSIDRDFIFKLLKRDRKLNSRNILKQNFKLFRWQKQDGLLAN